MAAPAADEAWCRETVPRVMELVSLRLPQRDVCALLAVSPWCYRALVANPRLWEVFDLREMKNASDRLIRALPLKISDKGIEAVTSLCPNLQALSIYWIVRLTDLSIGHITKNCRQIVDLNLSGCKVDDLQPRERRYQRLQPAPPDPARPRRRTRRTPSSPPLPPPPRGNNTIVREVHMERSSMARARKVRRTLYSLLLPLPSPHGRSPDFAPTADPTLRARLGATAGTPPRELTSVSPPNISDKGMRLIANSYQGLKKLNITRCIKLTDDGLTEVLQKCSSLESLNLYALSSFTDKVYKEIGLLSNLTFLDLCGAQNLSDDGLVWISRCAGLTYLNLTWCVRVTDAGVVAIAQGCRSIELLSLFGIVGVTDACLDVLSKSCSHSLTTLDVNGCIGIKCSSTYHNPCFHDAI
ncbi:hypothetical protein C2845_PM12G09660 [Panicum miliaceum]|uniref:F-box/LRR-repeat protein 15-like leucin rich repeat domain-containing protein n=1 Tax=Panicum miliaceum TaxID=4540 RepID=A0A3L6QK94_PANMI|nr:hypothetical protein C2845_PM12G09660 [Panicum miliaceum]